MPSGLAVEPKVPVDCAGRRIYNTTDTPTKQDLGTCACSQQLRRTRACNEQQRRLARAYNGKQHRHMRKQGTAPAHTRSQRAKAHAFFLYQQKGTQLATENGIHTLTLRTTRAGTTGPRKQAPPSASGRWKQRRRPRPNTGVT